MMNAVRSFASLAWRSVLFALGYALALRVGGMVGIALVPGTPRAPDSQNTLLALLLSSFLMALVLGPLARRIPATRSRHCLMWASLIFGNLGSVAIEGACFAPDLVPLPLPVLFLQQILAASFGAVLLAWLFGAPGPSPSAARWFAKRKPLDWAGWILLGCLSYLLCYFIFGALNYQLVTRPSYASHAGGLTVPPPQVVLAAELVRAPLIILSLLPLLLTHVASRRRMMLVAGSLLF